MKILNQLGISRRLIGLFLLPFFIAGRASAATSGPIPFAAKTDLLCLNYDHAPDKDDGHSAAADRTILESMFGSGWIKAHVLATSGAYGKNASKFNALSDKVMDAAWNDCGGWLAANKRHEKVVTAHIHRWLDVLDAGGDIWIKEGGQSDLTASILKRMKRQRPDLDTPRRIHVVQHSKWNERYTTEAALAYVKSNTHYIRIPDANAYLFAKGGDSEFVRAAITHPVFGPVWKTAFAYCDPKEKLDFSDTGILMHILGLGEMDLTAFRRRFLDNR